MSRVCRVRFLLNASLNFLYKNYFIYYIISTYAVLSKQKMKGASIENQLFKSHQQMNELLVRNTVVFFELSCIKY
jgi:hypothetical protein